MLNELEPYYLTDDVVMVEYGGGVNDAAEIWMWIVDFGDRYPEEQTLY